MPGLDLKDENQIYSVFSQNSFPKNTVLGYREFQVGDTKFYVCASLYSANIPSLDLQLNRGLEFFSENFNPDASDTLEEMKRVLFASGDFLADHLMEQKLPVDDVDYSVCFIGIDDGILYVWMDGDINLRIYRGSDSLLVNSERKPQFYGSTTVELGDILVLSPFKNISDADEKVEEYVLKNLEPEYPGLVIDYQVEKTLNELPEAVISREYTETVNTEITFDDEVESLEIDQKIPQRSTSSAISATRFDTEKIKESISNIRDQAANRYNQLKESGFFDKVKDSLSKVGTSIWNFLMSVSSGILDFIFGLIYRGSPHKLKRFQGSSRKKNLQYLLIVLFLISTTYLLFFRGLGSGTSSTVGGNNSSNITSQNNSQANTQKELQAKYDLLNQYSLTAQVDLFKQTYDQLNLDIGKARSNGFTNTTFLKDIETRAQSLEFSLYKITEIKKADQAFLATNIPNVQVVDFGIVANDAYAIDRANSQVLKSDGASLQLQVFASDKDLTAMSHITCVQTSCYILDDNIGLVILNLQTKTFSKFTSNEALKNAGVGAGEMEVYLVSNNPAIYVTYPSQSKLVRFTRNGDAFKAPETWNKSSGFTATNTDFAIDGGIFEMNADGGLRRFFGGSLDTQFTGLTPSLLPLGTSLQIATTPARATSPNNINRLYIADSENSRIVVYEKDLNVDKKYTFKGSYKYTGEDGVTFQNIKQIVLSTDEKTLYGLSNNVVFRIPVSAI